MVHKVSCVFTLGGRGCRGTLHQGHTLQPNHGKPNRHCLRGNVWSHKFPRRRAVDTRRSGHFQRTTSQASRTASKGAGAHRPSKRAHTMYAELGLSLYGGARPLMGPDLCWPHTNYIWLYIKNNNNMYNICDIRYKVMGAPKHGGFVLASLQHARGFASSNVPVMPVH